ncbi:helix-turn-helix domain-containing protein [Castellaniella ginsengisoli]|jgi:lambda repressor-like predicted transcriptional regulator|uniref:Helix-turn-helix transcriptional regulator n=2 Tax=Castellaniella ginsengisoli TaxID=546114 RepID=A0AB39GAN5_9BURK
MHMDVIELIYRLKRAGHTQVSLAQELGVSRGVVNDVIHDRGASLRVASHIAAVVGVDVDQLWPDRYKDRPQPRHMGTRPDSKEERQPEK